MQTIQSRGRRTWAALGIVIPALTVFTGLGTGGCTKQFIDSPPEPTGLLTTHITATGRGESDPSNRNARNLGSSGMRANVRGSLLSDPLTVDEVLPEGDRPLPKNGLCPADMASVNDEYCIDGYEASLLEVLPSGDERRWSPFTALGDPHADPASAPPKPTVRAVSEPSVLPQSHISGKEAAEACARSGKRLCKPTEWRKACKGPEKATYGYSSKNEPGRCNDSGRSPMGRIYASTVDLSEPTAWSWDRMNNPELNQQPGTLAKTGEHEGCTNGYGVYDMVGNLHEWVDDPDGTFQGGYYLDTHINGDGCDYRTMAHAFWYHDYSTGFRCCSDVAQ